MFRIESSFGERLIQRVEPPTETMMEALERVIEVEDLLGLHGLQAEIIRRYHES